MHGKGEIMDIHEFAALLNAREYGHEITREEEAQAKDLGFVVVFGYSDDNAEFRGAIHDEVGCWDNTTIYLNKDGIYQGCEHDPHCICKYIRAEKEKCKTIDAVWDGITGWPWEYVTDDFPYAEFEIFEDGQKYCRGIVFEMKELASA